MRRMMLASLLATVASIATAAPTPKEQLMVPPAGARHYVVSSSAGKHGDNWSWTMPDGSVAYRMSLNMRGWITEVDEVAKTGKDRRTTSVAVRGFTDNGDATEAFSVDTGGIAHWQTVVDSGSAPSGGKYYSTYGGAWLAGELDVDALVAAGDKGLDLLPTGHASIAIGSPVQVTGPQGAKTVKLAFISGYGFSPSPVWLDSDNRFFGNAGTVSLLPDGYEGNNLKLKDIQDKATADMVRDVAHRFLTPANRTPTLVDHVLMFDSVAGKYLADRAVLIVDGKVAKVGAGGSVKAPAGTTVIDGRGKTLTPGLWDSHRHVGSDDWNLLQNVATGMTNYRSPGSEIDEALSIIKRRAAGDLLAPDGKISVIIDQKGPLAANGGLTVTSEAETIAAVDKIKTAGLWGAKFYTSMNRRGSPPEPPRRTS